MLHKIGRYARNFIGIDTSQNMSISCMVTGPVDEIKKSFAQIQTLFKNEGIKKLHYKDIDKKISKRLFPQFIVILNNQKPIRYYVFYHKRPCGYSRNKYFFNLIPMKMSEKIVKLCNLPFNRNIILHCHDDFCFRKEGTKMFIRSLLKEISKTISPPEKGYKVVEMIERNGYKTILNINNKIIEILGEVKSSDDSPAASIADFVLGYNNDFPIEIKKITNLTRNKI